MSRKQLKELVKECLVELLSEGLGSALGAPAMSESYSSTSSPVQRQRQVSQKQRQFDPRLDTPVSQLNGSRQSSVMNETIKREAGGNPVMESIFADTARTTLATQLAHGDSSAMGGSSTPRPSQQEQFRGDPEQVFGEETASRWANLAFADSSPRRIA